MAYTLNNPYCTVTEVAEELKIAVPTASSAEEDEIKRAIYNASRFIDDYLRTDFFYHNHSSSALVLDESDNVFRGELFPPYKPIITITSITVGDDALVVDDDWYINRARDRIIRISGDWGPARPDNRITILGTFGYVQAATTDVPTAIPGHISHACRLIAAAFSGHNRKQVAGLDGVRTEVLTNEIPSTVYKILGKQSPIMI